MLEFKVLMVVMQLAFENTKHFKHLISICVFFQTSLRKMPDSHRLLSGSTLHWSSVHKHKSVHSPLCCF